MRDRSTFVPCIRVRSVGPPSPKTVRSSIGTKALRSLVRGEFIGLRQLQRLRRCAPCQRTYLGCAATPCIHLHLMQRASRDLISASLRAKRTTLLPHHPALRRAPEGRGQHAARALGDRWDEGDIGRQIRASILTAVGQRVSDDYDAEATTSDSTSARCRIQKSLDIANGLPSTRARAVDSHGRIVLCTHST